MAFCVNFFAADPIARISGATSNTLEYAIGYMRGYYIGAPFMALLMVLMPIVNLEGDKIINYISAITVMVVNLVGDLIASLYFKSVFAIGFATSIAYVCGILVLMIHFFSKKTMFHFSFKNIGLKSLKELIVTGGPNSAKAGFVFARNIVINNIVALVGSGVAMTAFSCQAHITPFLESITIGLISACLMLSSIFYSEEDTDALNNLIKTLIRWVFTVVLAFAIIYFTLAPYITKFYGVGGGNENDEAFVQTVWAMRADAISGIFIALFFFLGCK